MVILLEWAQIHEPLWQQLCADFHVHQETSRATELCGKFTMWDGHAKLRRDRCRTIFENPPAPSSAVDVVQNKFCPQKPAKGADGYCKVFI